MAFTVKEPEKIFPGPGLYFGMSDDDYHALPYLSASGMKNLLVSSMDFWANSWMNPFKERNDDDSVAKIVGRAYHKRILEGAVAFYSCYVQKFSCDKTEVLDTVADLKGWLKDHDLTQTGNKPDLIARIHAVDPTVPIYDVLEAQYEKQHAGKTFLSDDLIGRIEIAAAMIEKHPDLCRCFRGGYAEVTVIWQHKGVFFKARFDYLKPNAIIDLKTFANQMGKAIEKALYFALASYKYHIQAAHYVDAARQAVKFAKTPKMVHGEVDKDWLAQLAAADKDHEFYFVFQQKGNAPLARGMRLPQGRVFFAGEAAIEDATEEFKRCLSIYGTEPWVDQTMIGEFEDDLVPVWATSDI